MSRIYRPFRFVQSRHLVVLWIVTLCSGIAAPDANAALGILPPLPTMPAVGLENGLSALSYSIGGGISVIGVDPFGGAADGFSKQDTLFSTDFNVTLQNGGRAVASFGTASGIAIGFANAGFGKLRASAHTSGGGGFVQGETSVTTTFIDLVQANAQGEAQLNFDLNWKTNGTVSATPGLGDATAFAKFWFFPFGPLPPPNTNFFGNAYAAAFYQVGQPPFVESRGDLLNLTKGGNYWMVGELSVVAARSTPSGPVVVGPDADATADFMNTVELFIDPAADSPESSLFTFSGHDYATPLPEPSTLLLLGIGAISLLGYRKAKSHA